MAKYLVETYYNCSFKVTHYLDDVNEFLTNISKNLSEDRYQIKELCELTSRCSQQEIQRYLENLHLSRDSEELFYSF